MSRESKARVPRHVAVIMDGNGRWARRRAMPRQAGHRAGVKAAKRIVETCGRSGVEVLTLFAFSSENWKRPPSEVGALMRLFLEGLSERSMTCTATTCGFGSSETGSVWPAIWCGAWTRPSS